MGRGRRGAQPALFDTGAPEPVEVLVDQFKECFLAAYGLPYCTRPSDFVTLNRLFGELTRTVVAQRWAIAVANYFASPQSSHTLGDLAVRFPTFQRTNLDRYGKPAQTKGEERLQRNKAALAAFLEAGR